MMLAIRTRSMGCWLQKIWREFCGDEKGLCIDLGVGTWVHRLFRTHWTTLTFILVTWPSDKRKEQWINIPNIVFLWTLFWKQYDLGGGEHKLCWALWKLKGCLLLQWEQKMIYWEWMIRKGNPVVPKGIKRLTPEGKKLTQERKKPGELAHWQLPRPLNAFCRGKIAGFPGWRRGYQGKKLVSF